MLITLILTWLTLTPQPAAAAAATMPDGWAVRADSPEPHGTVSFVDMPPGWHVTTGPSVILYAPARTASGRYTVRSESFLFDPGTRREGYGILIGGAHLDGPAQRYTYFLIRRSGEYIIKRRAGDTVSTVRDWTPHAAILQYDRRGDAQTAKNVLGVDVHDRDVAFLVNGTEVARLPRAEIDTDGMVGLRINHEVNLHVSTLEVTPVR